MIPHEGDRVLLWAGAAHALVGVLCVAALTQSAAPILGLHPAEKPLKFAASIAIFLITMAFLLPSLSIDERDQRVIAWVLALTMVAEMVPIVVQALRGRTSHFNTSGPLNAALWGLMFVAIVIATLTLAWLAVIATMRPLRSTDAIVMTPLLQFAWRVALWIFLLGAVSGFRMGGQSRHSVGGSDGGEGLAVVNWSTTHGDLRVSHFFALHALQIIPLLALVVGRLPIARAAQWGLLLSGIAANVIVALWTLVRALAARPFI